MTIGEKIKKLRVEKDLSQENIYPNQSYVAQIEKGTAKNPGDSILRIIAENLEVTLDELIEGTDWEPKREANIQVEYALSPTQVNVKIEDTGQITIKRKFYNAYDKYGKERLYDPETGYKLITKCSKCDYTIQKANQLYCFGCGKKLFVNTQYDYNTYTKYYDYEGEIHSDDNLPPINYWYTQQAADTDIISNMLQIAHNIDRVSASIGIYVDFKRGMDAQNSVAIAQALFKAPKINCPTIITQEENPNNHENYYVVPKSRGNKNKIEESEFNDVQWMNNDGQPPKIIGGDFFKDFNPNDSKYEWFLPYWLIMMSHHSFYEGLLHEFRRHQIRLLDMDKKHQKIVEKSDTFNPEEAKNKE